MRASGVAVSHASHVHRVGLQGIGYLLMFGPIFVILAGLRKIDAARWVSSGSSLPCLNMAMAMADNNNTTHQQGAREKPAE